MRVLVVVSFVMVRKKQFRCRRPTIQNAVGQWGGLLKGSSFN
jgi:hypothetical protein